MYWKINKIFLNIWFGGYSSHIPKTQENPSTSNFHEKSSGLLRIEKNKCERGRGRGWWREGIPGTPSKCLSMRWTHELQVIPVTRRMHRFMCCCCGVQTDVAGLVVPEREEARDEEDPNTTSPSSSISTLLAPLLSNALHWPRTFPRGSRGPL